VKLPIQLRRLAYRFAYVVLCAYRYVARPSMHGVKCVLTDSDKVLLVRHTYGPAEWDLPGGGLRRNESPLSAARREMHEELGIVIDDWVAIGDLLAKVQNASSTMHCFRVELNEPQLTLDPGEIRDARWFPRRELPPNLARYVNPILSRTGLN
jgi:ADP-ribose pyrophosphatase YjhB (NUDIX family)